MKFARSIDPWRFAAAIAAATAYWLALAIAWARTQFALNGGLGYRSAVQVWSMSTVARYVPGNIWHIAGRAVLAKEAGGDPVVVISASAYEQVLTVLGALLVGGLLIPLAGVGLPWWIGPLTVPLTIAALHPRLIGPLIGRAADLFGWPRPAVLTSSQILKLLGWYCLPNVAAGIALVLIGQLGVLELPTATGAFAAAWLIGYLSILTPSGLGPREIVLTGLLAFHVAAIDGANIAIGHRLILTVAELLVAVSAAFSHHRLKGVGRML